MIKACIFDLDGTLANTLYDIKASTNFALEKFGFKTYDLESYRHFIGDGVKMLIKKALPHDVSEETRDKVLKEYQAHYKEHFMDNSIPYDGIIELLDELTKMNISINVLSNKPDEFTQPFVKEIFKGYNFDYVMGNKKGYPVKPDKGCILEALSALGLNSDECIYIGDSNVDVKTAHNGNLKCIGVGWGFRGRDELEEAGAEYVVDSPKEILEIVKSYT